MLRRAQHERTWLLVPQCEGANHILNAYKLSLRKFMKSARVEHRHGPTALTGKRRPFKSEMKVQVLLGSSFFWIGSSVGSSAGFLTRRSWDHRPPDPLAHWRKSSAPLCRSGGRGALPLWAVIPRVLKRRRGASDERVDAGSNPAPRTIGPEPPVVL